MEYSTLDSSDGLFTDGEESTVDYEDLDTFSKEEVSGATRSRVEWAQRLLVALRVLTIIHIVLNLRLLILSWTLYSVLGRFFAMLPFALEIVLALVFEALGSHAFWMGRRTTFNQCTIGKFAACGFYLVQCVWSGIVMYFMRWGLKKLLFEPAPVDVINADWAWFWHSFNAYVAFSCLNIIVSILLIGVIIAHWWFTSRTITDYDGLRPKRSTLARISYMITLVLYLLLVAAAVVMLILALCSTINLSGKFGRPSADSYENCDPLDSTSCIYPFPSSYYLRQDATTATRYRVNLGEKSLPKTMDGGRFLPTFWNELDGFSTIAPILFYLPGATNTTFIPHNNIGKYLEATPTTMILNVETGERMPHWTELDVVDPNFPSIIIQPAVPLEHKTRYLVIVQNVVGVSGAPVAASPYYLGLANATGPHNVDSTRWNMYQTELLPAMRAAGVNPMNVQMAWDFVTISADTNHGRFEQMRDIALTFQPTVTIVSDVESSCAVPGTTIGRAITAELTVPNFLQKKWGRGGFLPRTSSGQRAPIQQYGITKSYVVIRIPCSLAQTPTPQHAVEVVQYGHGLFGTRNEVQSGWIGPWLQATKMIFFASDWYGMSKFDELNVVKIILSDPTHFALIPESTLQGWANLVVIYKAMQNGALAAHLQTSGISLVPPNADIGYYGISQGGVVGGGYVSSSPGIKKAVLGVPGSPLALLLSRSHDFDMFHALFNLNLYNWRDIRLCLSLMQQLWDQGESAGWLQYMAENTSPKKNVLIQAAHGDAQVTILGAHIMARSYNATNLVPAVNDIWGTPDASTVTGSAITEWKYMNVPPMPFGNTPPSDEEDTHECIRREPEGQSQIYRFFTTGSIVQTCNGPCEKPYCAHNYPNGLPQSRDLSQSNVNDNVADQEIDRSGFLRRIRDILPSRKASQYAN